IIHTKQSLNHIRQKYHRKCVYILHPYFTDLAYRKTDLVFDILIWGSVRKSKGILEFLDFFVKSSSQLKILIVGKFNDTEYYEKVISCVNHNPNIIIENRYLCDEEFFDLHSKAKKILFIYNGPSVSNSGALIKSLSTGREIIGPNRGAFVDYKNLGLIETFNTFDDI